MLSTWEASQKYGFSTGHLRRLLIAGTLKGREVLISESRKIWLVDERSLQAYKRKERKPGPKRRA